MKKTCAFAPATIANLSVGFDILGIALSTVGDKVELTENTKGAHQITDIISEVELPYAIEKNSCSAVIIAMQEKAKSDVFVDIKIKKGYKAGSGLGSSAASSVAAAMAYNEMLGGIFSQEELIEFATLGEKAACGTAIYDNVCASLYGGLVFMYQGQVIQLPLPEDLYVLAYFQQIQIKTEDARNILPSSIPMADATKQMGNLAAFVNALHTKDWDVMRASMHDVLAEPYRKNLIPNYDAFQQIANDLGALAFGISGSGPTVFVWTKSQNEAEQIRDKFNEIVEGEAFAAVSFIENLNDSHRGAYPCEEF